MKKALPPFSTCRICSNSMTDVCVENCAVKKTYAFFKLNENALLITPQFPPYDFDEMPPRVQLKVMAAYITFIMKQLGGAR